MKTKITKYMIFAGWEVRIVKNCDRGLQNAARGRSPRSQFFTIPTDPTPVNNLFIFPSSKTKKTHGKKNSRKRYCDRGQR